MNTLIGKHQEKTRARPGIIIGKGGQEVDKLKEELKKINDFEWLREQFRRQVQVMFLKK